MKEIVVLSSKNYEQADSRNYGDCILINCGSELIIYDCGSQKHAETAIKYMDKHGFSQAELILSHNDSDHFDGIPILLKEKRLSVIKTTLLLKYKDDILKLIDDKRRKRDSVAKQILEQYDNIAKLSGAPLQDIYINSFPLCTDVSIVGPSKTYMLETVAKLLDGREGDTMDGESAFNATSIQASIKFDEYKVLLCGDSSYSAIEDKIYNYDAVQLPHHGKLAQAEKIFQKKYDQPNSIYIVSDNTGNHNGGSDALSGKKGYHILNTKNSNNIVLTKENFLPTGIYTGRTLGV